MKMLNMGELFRYPRIVDVPMARVELASTDEDRIKLKRGDLMFARRSLTLEGAGRCAIVHELSEPTTWEGSIIRARVDPSKASAQYLYYYFGSPAGRRNIETIVEQVAAAGIRLSDLARLRLELPGTEDQRAIAEVLGAVDDKIAANTKLSELIEVSLEVEATREWLGNVVSESMLITELFEINPSNPTPSDPEPAYVDMRKLPERGSGIATPERRAGKGGTRFMNGDTLMARITPCLENRKTGFVDSLDPNEVGIGSTEFIAIRSRSGFAKPLSYFVAVNEDFRDFAIRHMAGTSGRQRVSAADLKAYTIPRPNPDWLQDFGTRAIEQFELTRSVRDENRTLATLRDTLLPQLMSGKLRVRDAERSLSEVL